jgi:transposase
MVSRRGVYVKGALRRMLKKTNDKRLSIRIRIAIMVVDNHKPSLISSTVDCAVSTVNRVADRFREHSIEGLMDRREDNGDLKLDEVFLGQLREVVDQSPREFGYHRPTWTRELLVAVMRKLTGVRVHVGTMSRALRKIGARRGRPRPTVGCPWSKAAKTRRINAINKLRANCRRNEVIVYEDEVDIHLNPKIGMDWMNRGHQKEVLTPGKNQKRYLAGALNPDTGELTIVEGSKKNSDLFLRMLESLSERYRDAKRIYVILDNYRIHSSRIVQAALSHRLTKITLVFLPPYCPNENKIERVWKDLHDEVTRNHPHARMNELMKAVRRYLRYRNRRVATSNRTSLVA